MNNCKSKEGAVVKLLICGSRNFTNFGLLSERLDEYLSSADLSKVEIVSGGARGTDSLAERYAKSRNIKLTVFPADWERYGRAAGFVRNDEMAKYCSGPLNTCIAFWNGESSGTRGMMKSALRQRMSVVKVMYNDKKEALCESTSPTD